MFSLFEATYIHWLQSMVLSIPGGRLGAVFLARWLIVVFFVGLAIAYQFFHTTAWRKHWLKETAWSVLLAFVLAIGLSEFIQRIRPFTAFPQLVLSFVPTPSSRFSFPSAHAATAFAGAFAGMRALPSYFIPLGLSAMLIAFGRVLVGVHYPTDIVAGAMVGGIAATVVRWLHETSQQRLTTSTSL